MSILEVHGSGITEYELFARFHPFSEMFIRFTHAVGCISSFLTEGIIRVTKSFWFSVFEVPQLGKLKQIRIKSTVLVYPDFC